MAAIDDYLKKISDPVLREKLTDEVNKLKKTKKFGLVFEEHIPECTPLYGIPVKKGATVAKKGGKISEVYRVLKLQGEIAVCSGDDNTVSEHNIEDLVVVSQLDQPIYPYLEAIDKVENDPDSELWHTIIEADN